MTVLAPYRTKLKGHPKLVDQTVTVLAFDNNTACVELPLSTKHWVMHKYLEVVPKYVKPQRTLTWWEKLGR